jgi:hypothetical protein
MAVFDKRARHRWRRLVTIGSIARRSAAVPSRFFDEFFLCFIAEIVPSR